jgi:hypothetical protein
MFGSAIPKLHRFLQAHPYVDLDDHLAECTESLAAYIKSNLKEH